jgi:hypothetical protein
MAENSTRWIDRHLWGTVQSCIGLLGIGVSAWDHFHPQSESAVRADPPVIGSTMHIPSSLAVIFVLLFLSIVIPNFWKMVKDYKRQKLMKEALTSSTSHSNGMTDEQWKQHCESVAFQNRLIELGRSIDGVLGQRQIEALQVSTDLLKFLERMGTEPLPKYTAEEINTMPLSKSRALVVNQDGDYAEACEYHSRDGAWFFPRTWQNQDGMVNEMMTRWNRLYPWYQKVASGYALEMKTRVETLRHRFIVDGLDDESISLPVEGRDGAKNIGAIAKAFWLLAYKARERDIQSENS